MGSLVAGGTVDVELVHGRSSSTNTISQPWETIRVHHYDLGVQLIRWFGCNTHTWCLKHHD